MPRPAGSPRLPDFLLIGAAKSGTTALSVALQTHPQVRIPFKEPNFFSGWGTRLTFAGPHRDRLAERADRYCGTREEYEALFAGTDEVRVVGEASVSSLPAEDAARRIRDLVPGVKLIAVLRQPVDRAFSHFVMNRGYGIEPEQDFRRALLDEPMRQRARWHPFHYYQWVGRYAEQLARYDACFAADQMRVYLYEDWTSGPARVWSDVGAFLGLDPVYTPDFGLTHNEARVSYSAWESTRRALRPWLTPRLPLALRRAVKRTVGPLFSYRPQLDPELRHSLTQVLFRDEILRLQDRLERDLGAWLSDGPGAAPERPRLTTVTGS